MCMMSSPPSGPVPTSSILRDHATEGKSKQIHACEAECVEEGERMCRHSLDRLGDLAG